MKKVKRFLAVILVASLLLGSNGVSYAAEALEAGTESTEEAVQETAAEESSEVSVDVSTDSEAEPASEDSGEQQITEEQAGTSEDSEDAVEEDADTASDEAASTEETAEEPSNEEASNEEASDIEATEAAPAEETVEKTPADGKTDAAAEATTVAATEEVFKAGELSYKGRGYTVTLSYDESAKIPEGAQLKVREITKGSAEYEAYLQGAQSATDKGVAEARFFDITIWADGKEIQPQSAVRVNISYNDAIEVADEGEVQAMHFENGTSDPEVLSTDTNGGGEVSEIAFDAESFSVYGVIYTVDFTYGGYTFSMPGEGSILLSDLAEKLGLYEKDLDKAFSVSNVSDVTFTDYDLLKIEKQADGDWLLTSLASFTSEETLTVLMKDGVKFEIKVTDPPAGDTGWTESSDLTNFLTNAAVSGATQQGGAYVVEKDKPYGITLTFKEGRVWQFANHETLTYSMPEGMYIPENQTSPMMIAVVSAGKTYEVAATLNVTTDGKITIKFDENDPNFNRLANANNVSLRAQFEASFDGTKDKIHFSDSVEKDVIIDTDDHSNAFATKSGSFDETTGKYTYTITVSATGNPKNVNVKDVISGTALIFNNDVQVSGNSSSYTTNPVSGKGFDYTFAEMQDGEVITITYSASLDPEKMKNADSITADMTKNTATVQKEGGEPHTAEYSHTLDLKKPDKSGGEDAGTDADGNKLYKWTIEYNPLALAGCAGDVIKDTIGTASREYMKYYGDVTVKVYDHSGNLTDTRTFTPGSDSAWQYTVPSGDTTPYRYVFEYETVVDQKKVDGLGKEITITNEAEGPGGKDGSGITVGPKELITITKEVVTSNTDEVTWISHIHVPENGLAQAVVTDTLPHIYFNNQMNYDAYKDGTLEISGLLPGESYDDPAVSQDKVVITFYKDAGKTQTGLQGTEGGHDITVKLTTKVNQTWLEYGYEHASGYEADHKNIIDLNQKQASAQVTFSKPDIKKTGAESTDWQGNKAYLYTIVVSGVTEEPISIADQFDTSVLQLDTENTDWQNLIISGGNQYSQDAGKYPIGYSETEEGVILTANSVPKQANGEFYPYYKITYYAKLKEGVDTEELAIENGGKYELINTAQWGDHESEFKFTYEYDALKKELITAATAKDHFATYKITFNPKKATLNNGEPIEMKDTLNANLSIDHSSVTITTDPAGMDVPYTISGEDDEEGHPTGGTVAVYQIPDETAVTIEYRAMVVGTGSVTYKNEVEANGEKEIVQENVDMSSGGGGEASQLSVKVVKVDGYDANKKLQGVKFRLYSSTGISLYPADHPKYGTSSEIIETDENGVLDISYEKYGFSLVEDERYYLEELEAAPEYQIISFPYQFTLTQSMDQVDWDHYVYFNGETFQIKNWPLEGLVVEKIVDVPEPEPEGESYKEQEYGFKVEILNDEGEVDTSVNQKYGDYDFVNGATTFTLKDKEQVSFWDMPKDTKFRVTETDSKGLVVWVGEGETSEKSADGSYSGVTEGDGEYTLVTFTNKKPETGSLKLKKLVTVDGEATTGTLADGTYTFTITGPGEDGEVSKTVTITVTNGVAVSATIDGETAELDSGKYVEVTDLEAGVYTINETAPTNRTSLVGDNNKTVTVEAGKSGEDVSDAAKADFTNNIDTGSLKIKKNVTFNGAPTTGTEADGTYTFEVKDADGTVVANKTITIENGVSNEVQVDGLVPGEYTITEAEPTNGTVLVGNNNVTVTVTAGATATVPMAEFTNNKPGTPEFEKKIQDTNDSTGDTSDWQDSADYDIGDEVPYKLTATLPGDVSKNSSYSIKFEDKMESSLTFKEVTKVVLNNAEITNECEIESTDAQSFTVSKSWTEDAITDALNGATVEVYFTATLNENAKLGAEGNVNAARLHYDNKAEITEDSGKTPWDYVIAFTYKLDINKVDQDGNALEGAEFKLEKKLANETTTEITLSKESNVFTGTGLDDGVYVLTETTAPEGYKPIDPITFTVTADHEIEWDYTSDALNFDGEGRLEILTALTGDTESGDLTFEALEELEGLEGTLKNQKTGSLKIKKNVTVDGQPTTGTEADGTYTFEVKNAADTSAETKTITITIENGASGEVQVDGLVPGTYIVSEQTGTNPPGMILVTENDLEIVVTADETATVPTAEFTNNKPGTPTFEKKIQDINDSDGVTSGWQDSADYDIGDAIPYKLTATLAKDVSNYKSYTIQFEDQMEESLTFNRVTQVILTKKDGSTQDITLDCVFSPSTGGHRFTVTTGWGRNYSERMPISELLNGATVEVYFTATLNEDAKIGSDGNVNAARLRYSNNPSSTDDSEYTPWDYVIAFTYKLDINKVDQDGEALTGAAFKLEKKLVDGTTKEITLSQEGNVFTGTGLDDGDYVLTETTVPAGHKSIDPIEFTVSADHNVTWNYTSTGDAPVFDGEGRGTILATLTGSTQSGDLEFADPQSVEGLEGTVTNQAIGSLKLKKNVTVNGEATTGQEADGTYEFTITGPSDAAEAEKVTKAVTITVTNGVAESATVDGTAVDLDEDGFVEVAGLNVGEYTITEAAPENGTVLVGDNDVTVTVIADTTAEVPTAVFTNNKPGTPEFEKKIQDTNDTTGETSGWQDSADYDIGDAVPYKLTATLPNDVSTNESYSIKFEDQMESTLTFAGVSQVLLNGDDITDACTITPASGGQSFTVSKSWSGDAVKTLDGATVEVFFTATLNDSASIGSEGNVNAARLHYDNKSEITPESGKTTDWDYVIAFTYKLDVNKVDQDGEALEGAEFKLEKVLNDGTKKEITLSKAGNVFTGKGLDDGDYVLTETTAPTGYKPIDPIEFTVTADHEVVWDYTSAELAFNGDSRFAILTALTGETDSGDLKFAEQQSKDGLTGTVTNQGIGALKIEKVVTGTAATDKNFTFEIALTAPEDTELDSSYPATLDGEETDDAAVVDGKVTVTLTAGQVYEITGLPAGTTYTVTETDLPDGYTEGTHTGNEGTIEVGETAQAVMNNTYETAGEVTFNGTKTLEGRDLKKDEFTFELYESGKETPIQTVTNNADGSYAFETIEYSGEDLDTDQETGAFVETVKTYTIKEKAGTDTSITYDDTEYEITVTLNDNGDGTITAVKDPDPEGGYAFTNEYEAKGEVTFGGVKTMEGQKLEADAYTFELYERGQTDPIQTVTNEANGDFSFETITYTLEDLNKNADGKYIPTEKYYTVKEVKGESAGVTYDETVYEITVTISDDGTGSGKLTVETDKVPGACNFKNTYETKGEITFSGTKTLENKALEEGMFTFELYDSEGTLIEDVTNAADGSYSFTTIKYTGADLDVGDDGNYVETTKTYTVVEKAEGKAGITYDGTEYEITVTLKDDGEGTIEVSADPKENTYDFTNTYETKGEITFSGTKTLKNRALEEGEFSFELYDLNGDEEQLVETVTNKADGSYSFTTIEYTGSDLDKDADGNYAETTKTYKVVEKAGDDSSITYDTTEYEITVTLKDDGEGTIVTSADPAEDSYDFTNTYNTKGEITFSGTKTLENKVLEEGMFTFELYDSEGALIEDVTNAADGSYSFTKISYTGSDLDTDDDGNYVETTKTYKVVEKAGEAAGIEYDDTEYEITVTLTDDGEGTIKAVADPKENTYDFTNTYETEGKTVIGGVKVLEGRELKDGEFTFELKDENGDVVKTAANDADGNFSFEELTFTGEDLDTDADGNYIETTKTYTVAEKAGSDTTITYDGSEYTVELTLTDDGNGNIEVVKNPEDAAAQTFKNTYEAKGEVTFGGKKTLEGRALTEGEFSFELKDAEGNVLETVTNDADGNYSFTTIKYTLADLDKDGGKYIPTEKVYTVSEVSGEDENVEYDDKVYTITCVLTDKGDNTIEVTTDEVPGACDFTNTYNTKGEITFSGKKTLENRALFAGEFAFELYDSEGTQIDLVFNEDDGSYSFSKIEYTGEDLDKDDDGNFIETTKTYKVVEKAGDDSSVTYDSTEYEITVTLKDNGEGTIETSADPKEDTYDFTNTYETEGEITFSGEKTLENRKLTEGEFSFELYDEDGTLLETVTNAADGSYNFTTIEYTGDDLDKDSAGNYLETIKNYRVVEKAGEDGSVTYDDTEYEITVTLTDNGKGTIEVTADPAEDSYDFTNTYNTKGEITFSGEKTLENRALTEGEFSFELYDSEGTLLETATNKADGSYSFTTIEYTGDDLDKDADGYYVETTKTYKVVEKAGEDSSVTYDDTEYEITVTLTDDGEGTIAVTADPAEDSYDFTNTYSAKGSYVFEAEKILKGRPLTFGQFSFELYDSEGNLIQTAESDNDGSVTFEAIEYTQDDMDKEESGDLKDTVKTYTLKEVTKDDKGYTYSEAVYKINVTLHDDKAGTIETSADKDKIDLTFTNIYEAEGEIVLNAQKELLGERALEEGQFTFELKDANGKVIDSKTNAADGSVTFDAIKYTQDDIYEVDPETGVYSGADTKTLTYTISEVIPEGAKDNGDGTFFYNGYTYDGTVYTVDVVLTDNGDGTITAVVAGSEDETGTTEAGTEGGTTEGGEEAAATDYVFTNAYDAAGTLKLDAEKIFKNGTLKGGEFTFELKDAEGNVLQSKKNDAAGNVSFDLIAYSMKDLAKSPITYTVNEVVGSDTDVKYDEKVYTVTVTLADNGDGTLSVTKKIDNGGALKFVNEQMNVETSITIGGVKVLKGQNLKAGQFKFVMVDENGKKIDEARNDADGNFTFDSITYKLSDLSGEKKKVFTYGISEVKGSDRRIIYDEKVHTVVVTVTDNGDGTMTATADKSREDIRFVNTTRDKTGDEAPLGVLFGGFGIGVIGLAVLLEDRRRRNKNK